MRRRPPTVRIRLLVILDAGKIPVSVSADGDIRNGGVDAGEKGTVCCRDTATEVTCRQLRAPGSKGGETIRVTHGFERSAVAQIVGYVLICKTKVT